MEPITVYIGGGIACAVTTGILFKKMKESEGVVPSKKSLAGMAFLGFLLGLGIVHIL